MVPETSSLVFLQYLTTVFDTITDAILLIGIEKGGFRLLTANNAFFTSTGYPHSSVGKDVSDIVSPASYAFLVKKYKKAMRTKRPLEYTRWNEVPAGRRAFAVRFIPILNTVGEVVQLASVSRDVTDELSTQEELARLRARLQEIETLDDA